MGLIKYFEVDTDEPDGVQTKHFRYDDEQPEAEAYCKEAKARGIAVNIRIIKVPFRIEE